MFDTTMADEINASARDATHQKVIPIADRRKQLSDGVDLSEARMTRADAYLKASLDNRNVFTDAGEVDHRSLSLHRVTLSYEYIDSEGKQKPQHLLNSAFAIRNASRYRLPLRVTTCILCLVNLLFIVYDHLRFGNGSDEFLIVVLLRVCGIVPVCFGIVIFTYTNAYLKRSDLLVWPALVVGSLVVAYSITGKDPGYGTLALTIVYLYSFTPLHFWVASGVCISLIIAFLIGIVVTKPVEQTAASAVDIFGTLFLFFIAVGFVGHTLQYLIKKSFLDEYILRVDSDLLKHEKNVSNKLLQSMLPAAVLNQLKQGRSQIAESFSSVTVLFCEIYHFAEWCGPRYTQEHGNRKLIRNAIGAEDVVRVLNIVYSTFDSIIDSFPKLHKVETVNEVYMVVGGCPTYTPRHAEHAANMALAMMQNIPAIRATIESELSIDASDLEIRIGLNSGPIVAGVTGILQPRFKLFGDTVNTASRMESTSDPGAIQISQFTYDLLKNGVQRFKLVPRGGVEVKGKGKLNTWWLRHANVNKLQMTTLSSREIVNHGDFNLSMKFRNAISSKPHEVAIKRDTTHVRHLELISPNSQTSKHFETVKNETECRSGSQRSMGTAIGSSGQATLPNTPEQSLLPKETPFVSPGRGELVLSSAPVSPVATNQDHIDTFYGDPRHSRRRNSALSDAATARSSRKPSLHMRRGSLDGSKVDSKPNSRNSRPSARVSRLSQLLVSASSSNEEGSMKYDEISDRVSSRTRTRSRSQADESRRGSMSRRSSMSVHPSLQQDSMLHLKSPDEKRMRATLVAMAQGKDDSFALDGSDTEISRPFQRGRDQTSSRPTSESKKTGSNDIAQISNPLNASNQTSHGMPSSLGHLQAAANTAGVSATQSARRERSTSVVSLNNVNAQPHSARIPVHGRIQLSMLRTAGLNRLQELTGTSGGGNKLTGSQGTRTVREMPSRRMRAESDAMSDRAFRSRALKFDKPKSSQQQKANDTRHRAMSAEEGAQRPRLDHGTISVQNLRGKRMTSAAQLPTSSDAVQNALENGSDIASDASSEALYTYLDVINPEGAIGIDSPREINTSHSSWNGQTSLNADDDDDDTEVFRELVQVREEFNLPTQLAAAQLRASSGYFEAPNVTIDTHDSATESASRPTHTATAVLEHDRDVRAAWTGKDSPTVVEITDYQIHRKSLHHMDSPAADPSIKQQEATDCVLLPVLTPDAGAEKNNNFFPEQTHEREEISEQPLPKQTRNNAHTTHMASQNAIGNSEPAKLRQSRTDQTEKLSTKLSWTVSKSQTDVGRPADMEARNVSQVPGKMAMISRSTMGSDVKQRREMLLRSRVALCFYYPGSDGVGRRVELAYLRQYARVWRRFARISAVLCSVALVLFLVRDAVLWFFTDELPSEYTAILILRYAVLLPLLAGYVWATYSTAFRINLNLAQILTGSLISIVGGTLIAISILGGDPGYGVLALFVVYSLNISLVAFAYRVAIMFVLILSYCLALLFSHTAQTSATAEVGDTSGSSVAKQAMYLLVFFLGQAGPVYFSEYHNRHNFMRNIRVKRQRRALAEERIRAHRLLLNILPAQIVESLREKRHGSVLASTHEECTILFTDLRGFTAFSSGVSPTELVSFLNVMFSTFDRITHKYGIHKVEIIGDAYFCVAGCPTYVEDHAERCANAALEMLLFMPRLREVANADIRMRIGIHTGPAIAGVVGRKDPRYHLFGKSVEIAMAMESNGIPDHIQVSQTTFDRLMRRQKLRAEAYIRATAKVHRARVEFDRIARARDATSTQTTDNNEPEHVHRTSVTSSNPGEYPLPPKGPKDTKPVTVNVIPSQTEHERHIHSIAAQSSRMLLQKSRRRLDLDHPSSEHTTKRVKSVGRLISKSFRRIRPDILSEQGKTMDGRSASRAMLCKALSQKQLGDSKPHTDQDGVTALFGRQSDVDFWVYGDGRGDLIEMQVWDRDGAFLGFDIEGNAVMAPPIEENIVDRSIQETLNALEVKVKSSDMIDTTKIRVMANTSALALDAFEMVLSRYQASHFIVNMQSLLVDELIPVTLIQSNELDPALPVRDLPAYITLGRLALETNSCTKPPSRARSFGLTFKTSSLATMPLSDKNNTTQGMLGNTHDANGSSMGDKSNTRHGSSQSNGPSQFNASSHSRKPSGSYESRKLSRVSTFKRRRQGTGAALADAAIHGEGAVTTTALPMNRHGTLRGLDRSNNVQQQADSMKQTTAMTIPSSAMNSVQEMTDHTSVVISDIPSDKTTDTTSQTTNSGTQTTTLSTVNMSIAEAAKQSAGLSDISNIPANESKNHDCMDSGISQEESVHEFDEESEFENEIEELLESLEGGVALAEDWIEHAFFHEGGGFFDFRRRSVASISGYDASSTYFLSRGLAPAVLVDNVTKPLNLKRTDTSSVPNR